MPERERTHALHHQGGQALVEYSLLILFVALVVFGALILLGPAIANVFSNIRPAL